jgi:hypothetical protein
MTEQNTVTAQDMATVHNTATAQNTATEQNTATAFGTKQGQDMANDRKTALALGATGGFGGEMARALLGRGWRVRAISRHPDRIGKPIEGIEWMRGDAMNRADIVAAAEGTDLIVHGVNPPGYRNWRGLALPMLENTVAAARASGARILFQARCTISAPTPFRWWRKMRRSSHAPGKAPSGSRWRPACGQRPIKACER